MTVILQLHDTQVVRIYKLELHSVNYGIVLGYTYRLAD